MSTDSATWVCFTNGEMALLKDYLEAGRPLTEDETSLLLNRIDTYLSPDAKDPAYRAVAAELDFVREGECEIDDHAVVSVSDDGAYVMAWVWVPNDPEA
ncbi:hypothetical protein [Sphingopyxis flava]|uniref:Uncharacterized protein n=1 Tax=Sphingopyxis flava TaxID=1507287 RepID=A0A1T5CU86_9SPHN|nr:hypothetical protein [Sphingopyxis flava]SKB63032.1 hypothetical protein SAMN06295937_1011124 [Sphingopyxis flava]